MNKPMITSPSHTTAEQETLTPAHKGIHLVCRQYRRATDSARPTPAKPTPAKTAPARGIALVGSRTSEPSQPAVQGDQAVEARSAESIRIKLAACFGAVLTAPLVWCLHTLVLSLQTR